MPLIPAVPPKKLCKVMNTLQLEDVYAVLAYYLAHRVEVDDYLREQEADADNLWQESKSRPDYQEFRTRLLARKTPNNQ